MIDTDFNLLQYQYEKLQVDDFDIYMRILQSLYDDIKFNSYFRDDVGILSMYYSIYQANKLKCEYEKDNDIIFDRVIRMRFDSDFVNELLNLKKQ